MGRIGVRVRVEEEFGVPNVVEYCTEGRRSSNIRPNVHPIRVLFGS